jgi:hypothetical protein
MTVKLSTLAKGAEPLTTKELQRAQDWVDDDWESHDIDRDAVRLIKRLLATVAQGIKKS